MKNAKLQKEINALAKLEMVEGELFISVQTKATNGKELNEISDSTLASIEVPKGFEQHDNMLSRKGLRIYISFTK